MTKKLAKDKLTNLLSRIKRFHRSVLLKKTPLLGFTVLELAILWVVITGGITAIAITNHQHAQKNISDADTSQPVVTNLETTTPTTTESWQETSDTPIESSAPTQANNSAQSAYEDAKFKLEWQQKHCLEPMSQINGKFLDAQRRASSNYESARNAITYAPGTEQYRAAYNSAAYTKNKNIEMAYTAYISDVKILNMTPECNLSPTYKKYPYSNMLDADHNFVPYVEGSGLYDY